ncbi:MAG TPA: hypothetical protein ENI61_04850 [Ignavibacteria bacterium]|nr:hypothetical protein [Ignavibacteria bacterium]
MSLENIKKSMQILWKNKPYLFLAVAIALGSGYLLYIFSSTSMILYMDSVFYIVSSLGLSVLISILFGIDLSLIVYKFNFSRKMGLKESSSSIFGVVGGVIGSGCPICGATVLGFLGVSGGLAILPFNGLGLKALSLGLMLFATYKVSENISNCKKCKIKGVKK